MARISEREQVQNYKGPGREALMIAETQAQLQQIRKLLQEIGDRLSAIDHDAGNSIAHWQKIGENDEKVRSVAANLPKDIQAKCPEMMMFVNAGKTLQFSWGICIDEVEASLQE